jgi:putative FmdB family regulatory protein
MPTYDFSCTACGLVVEDVQLPIADRDYPTTQPCPQCEQLHTIERLAAAPAIGDGYRLGRRQLPSTWTDTLKRIKSKHRHSTINDYGSKKEL